jgi:hypothetical protein
MKYSAFVLVLMMLSLSGCPKSQVVVHVPDDTNDCPAACKHLRGEDGSGLKCEEGNPLEDGTTCEKFCENSQNSGHALTPSCVLKITKCSDMEHLDDFCTKNN